MIRAVSASAQAARSLFKVVVLFGLVILSYSEKYVHFIAGKGMRILLKICQELNH
jgi:hypothetical protein